MRPLDRVLELAEQNTHLQQMTLDLQTLLACQGTDLDALRAELMSSSNELASGYTAPVGDDRRFIWPPNWIDATGYAHWYSYGWHTGADLNLNSPHWDADRHRPVYAIAHGEVYAVRQNVSGWQTVICIRHEDCLSRYAHCENIAVQKDDIVQQGDYLGNIGNAGGRYPYHLHFDIARLDARMADYPLDWPGRAVDARERVLRDYCDPRLFLLGEVG